MCAGAGSGHREKSPTQHRSSTNGSERPNAESDGNPVRIRPNAAPRTSSRVYMYTSATVLQVRVCLEGGWRESRLRGAVSARSYRDIRLTL